MNTVVLVGRLTGNPEVTVTENGKHITKILLAVNRNYKNVDGIYETDFVRCVLWNTIAEHTCEYCSKGDTVGIKGRIQTSSYTKDDTREYITEVLVEKLSFVMSKKNPDKVLQLEDATLE